jgi:ketosteroid isomerase-like protein
MTQQTAATMTQSDTEILRGAYAAFAAGDVPAVLGMFSDDITWHEPGRNPLAGDYTGHDEVVGFFQALGERCDGTFGLDVRQTLDDGQGTVVALVTETAERNGARLALAAVHVWRFANGRATSFEDVVSDDHALDAFWA